MKGGVARGGGNGRAAPLSPTQTRAPLLLVVLLPMLLLFVEKEEGHGGRLVHNVLRLLRSSRPPSPRKQCPGERSSCVSLSKREGGGLSVKRRRRPSYHLDATPMTARGARRDTCRRSFVGARGGGTAGQIPNVGAKLGSFDTSQMNGVASDGFIEEPYAVLGVQAGSPIELVTKTYRRLAARYHPDKAKPQDRKLAHEHFSVIKRAYDSLTIDTVKKQWTKEKRQRDHRKNVAEQRKRDGERMARDMKARSEGGGAQMRRQQQTSSSSGPIFPEIKDERVRRMIVEMKTNEARNALLHQARMKKRREDRRKDDDDHEQDGNYDGKGMISEGDPEAAQARWEAAREEAHMDRLQEDLAQSRRLLEMQKRMDAQYEQERRHKDKQRTVRIEWNTHGAGRGRYGNRRLRDIVSKIGSVKSLKIDEKHRGFAYIVMRRSSGFRRLLRTSGRLGDGGWPLSISPGGAEARRHLEDAYAAREERRRGRALRSPKASGRGEEKGGGGGAAAASQSFRYFSAYGEGRDEGESFGPRQRRRGRRGSGFNVTSDSESGASDTDGSSSSTVQAPPGLEWAVDMLQRQQRWRRKGERPKQATYQPVAGKSYDEVVANLQKEGVQVVGIEATSRPVRPQKTDKDHDEVVKGHHRQLPGRGLNRAGKTRERGGEKNSKDDMMTSMLPSWNTWKKPTTAGKASSSHSSDSDGGEEEKKRTRRRRRRGGEDNDDNDNYEDNDDDDSNESEDFLPEVVKDQVREAYQEYRENKDGDSQKKERHHRSSSSQKDRDAAAAAAKEEEGEYALPKGWRTAKDEKRGIRYFYHKHDRVPQWSPPPGAKLIPAAAGSGATTIPSKQQERADAEAEAIAAAKRVGNSERPDTSKTPSSSSYLVGAWEPSPVLRERFGIKGPLEPLPAELLTLRNTEEDDDDDGEEREEEERKSQRPRGESKVRLKKNVEERESSSRKQRLLAEPPPQRQLKLGRKDAKHSHDGEGAEISGYRRRRTETSESLSAAVAAATASFSSAQQQPFRHHHHDDQVKNNKDRDGWQTKDAQGDDDYDDDDEDNYGKGWEAHSSFASPRQHGRMGGLNAIDISAQQQQQERRRGQQDAKKIGDTLMADIVHFGASSFEEAKTPNGGMMDAARELGARGGPRMVMKRGGEKGRQRGGSRHDWNNECRDGEEEDDEEESCWVDDTRKGGAASAVRRCAAAAAAADSGAKVYVYDSSRSEYTLQEGGAGAEKKREDAYINNNNNKDNIGTNNRWKQRTPASLDEFMAFDDDYAHGGKASMPLLPEKKLTDADLVVMALKNPAAMRKAAIEEAKAVRIDALRGRGRGSGRGARTATSPRIDFRQNFDQEQSIQENQQLARQVREEFLHEEKLRRNGVRRRYTATERVQSGKEKPHTRERRDDDGSRRRGQRRRRRTDDDGSRRRRRKRSDDSRIRIRERGEEYRRRNSQEHLRQHGEPERTGFAKDEEVDNKRHHKRGERQTLTDTVTTATAGAAFSSSPLSRGGRRKGEGIGGSGITNQDGDDDDRGAIRGKKEDDHDGDGFPLPPPLKHKQLQMFSASSDEGGGGEGEGGGIGERLEDKKEDRRFRRRERKIFGGTDSSSSSSALVGGGVDTDDEDEEGDYNPRWRQMEHRRQSPFAQQKQQQQQQQKHQSRQSWRSKILSESNSNSRRRSNKAPAPFNFKDIDNLQDGGAHPHKFMDSLFNSQGR